MEHTVIWFSWVDMRMKNVTLYSTEGSQVFREDQVKENLGSGQNIYHVKGIGK